MTKTPFLLVLLLLCFSCGLKKENQSGNQESKITEFDYSDFGLKSGDILFQDSDCGPFCESIEKVTRGINGSNFSHVGMVIPNEQGEFMVIEAITDGVVETSLEEFFTRSFDENNNSKVVVGRLKPAYQHLIPKAIDFAKSKSGYSYDEIFDISNDKYYCSELLYDSFKHANNDQPIFQLQKMTYKDPETNSTFPVWEEYFRELNIPVPEGEPGINPGGMSKSEYIDIVHFYGIPEGYQGSAE